MKTSSVEFISRSPTPSPMERNYRRFVLLRKIFEPWQWKRRKRKIVLNRRPELYRGKYRCILLWSPWKYRCGQRTVRMAIMACSQIFARRRIESKLKQRLLDIRAEKESEGERERPSVHNSVYATLCPEVHEQMFRSGGQSDTKPPVLSSQVSLVLILSTHGRDERPSQLCPARGLNLGPVVWKRDALTTQH
ncbi:hypothetical protein TNCV_790681 [Trichonephila clavipes]|nr:hypothetical protein TNCV_790681 [Trichonephila clavipes]